MDLCWRRNLCLCREIDSAERDETERSSRHLISAWILRKVSAISNRKRIVVVGDDDGDDDNDNDNRLRPLLSMS